MGGARSAAPCRACGEIGLKNLYRADRVPVHNCVALRSRAEALAFPTGSLEIDHCPRCGFIQNSSFDAARLDYSQDYEESQVYSARFRRFSEQLCAAQIQKFQLKEKHVLEIGCGKGDFLLEICQMGNNTGLGIDPACRPERFDAGLSSRGVRLVRERFDARYRHLRADYICCRHTLEHIGRPRPFLESVHRVAQTAPETVVFFEVPDVERVLQEGAFWDLYYEHCNYFSPRSLTQLFVSCGFEVLDLYRGFEDQYLMIEARAQTTPLPGADACDPEATAPDFSFAAAVDERRKALQKILGRAERPVLWGGGSKAVACLSALQPGTVEFVVDINPYRQGVFLPASGCRVVSPDFLRDYEPDLVVVMNSIYRREVETAVAEIGSSAHVTAL